MRPFYRNCDNGQAFVRTVTSATARGRLRYDTICYFNVRSKADISQLNLPHGLLADRIKRDGRYYFHQEAVGSNVVKSTLQSSRTDQFRV